MNPKKRGHNRAHAENVQNVRKKLQQSEEGVTILLVGNMIKCLFRFAYGLSQGGPGLGTRVSIGGDFQTTGLDIGQVGDNLAVPGGGEEGGWGGSLVHWVKKKCLLQHWFPGAGNCKVGQQKVEGTLPNTKGHQIHWTTSQQNSPRRRGRGKSQPGKALKFGGGGGGVGGPKLTQSASSKCWGSHRQKKEKSRSS